MKPRPLTPGEIALAETVFGNSIDYARVTITDGQFIGFQPKGTAMAPEGNLYMYGCYKPDYATGDAYTQGHFIHEMTHVWQYQNKVLKPIVAAVELNFRHAFNYMAAYDYTLDARKDLLDYNMEQQASIVQDYFITKTAGHPAHRGHCKNACTPDDKINLFEKVLDKFLHNPHYARQADFPATFRKPKPPGA